MSTIVKTPAVVLRTMKYRETSRIATFYTKEFGKMSGIVKGARQTKSKYGASLEPMSYVSLVFYRKEGRDLQTVSACDTLRPLRALAENLEKMSIGMSIIELVSIVAHEEEENPAFFQLLVDTLTALNDAAANCMTIFYYFEIRLAAILGFRLTCTHCLHCGKSILTGTSNEIQFHLIRGGVLCSECEQIAGHKVPISRKTLENLIELQASADPAQASKLAIEIPERKEIGSLLWNYLRYHVSGMRALKSESVFSKILADS